MTITQGLQITILPVGKKIIDCSGLIQWAETWDWGVGEIVAKRLTNNEFNDWETVVVLTINKQYAGFCILEKKDDWGIDIDPALTPFITAVYIDPKFRGRRLSEELLEAACDVVRLLKFNATYLISSTEDFYEKLGFKKIAQTITLSGSLESVYEKRIV